MTRIVTSIAVMVMLIVAVANDAIAQGGIMWRGGGGWGPGAAYNRMYDPQSVGTIIGEVVSVDRITPMRGMSYGAHMVVKTDQALVSVHLGPGWYIENQEVKLVPGNKVEVKGSQIMFQGKPALIAAEVKKGNEALMLRDANGVPVWSGWRRG